MHTTIGCALGAALLVLTACAGTDSAETVQPGAGRHTMSDGTVMDGETHRHDDSHDHGAEGNAAGPSAAAEMVCAGQVVDDVARIMALDTPVEPSSTWDNPMFTCTFNLEQGPLMLRVHDADDRPGGMAHFQSLRTGQPGVTPLRGIESLGLPAFETQSGTVAFIRDGKTLEVDARGLTGKLGTEGEKNRTELAYAVATSVLACWTDHT